jgi:DNA-binding beta-propeller fold protein YncE
MTGTAWGASGVFERTWGKDVIAGGTAIAEICTQAENCKAGINGAFDLGGEFSGPEDVAVDSAGYSYVADTGNNRIQKFDPAGHFILAWGKDVVAGNEATDYEICIKAENCQSGSFNGHDYGGEFELPSGIAVDASGNAYVADYGNDRIQKFDSSGHFELTWGRDVNIFGGSGFETCNAEVLCRAGDPGGKGGEFKFPTDVAVGPGGDVYVVDTDNLRVQKFSPSADFLATWGKDVLSGAGNGYEVCNAAAFCQPGQGGSLAGEFYAPQHVTAGAAGVYVGDGYRVQEFTPSGSFLRTWGKDVVAGGGTGFEICTQPFSCRGGSAGRLGGELYGNTFGLGTDSGGNVYVTDDQRIQKFDGSGNFLRTWGKDVLAGGGTGFEICTVPANCQAGSEGGLGGELRDPVGLAIGPGGKLYVAEYHNYRVQVFGDALVLPGPPPTGTDGPGSQTGTLGAVTTANPQCQLLRKKLKKAKTTAAKKKVRRKLRRLGC